MGSWVAGAAALAGCAAPEPAPAPAPGAAASTPRVGATSVSNLILRSSIGDARMIVMRPRDVAGPLLVCLALLAALSPAVFTSWRDAQKSGLFIDQ